jgi:magnesium transporter
LSKRSSDPILDEPVTSHMRTDFPRLREGWTVAQALAEVRNQVGEGRIIYFYVVDDQQRLLGVVPTRRLLLGDPQRKIGELMVHDVVTIPKTATVLEACEFFVMHRLLAFPVVDEQRRILGIVDVELYTEELSDLEASERSDHLFQLIGVRLAEAQQASAIASYKLRLPWLLCNIAGGIVAAFLASLFEAELKTAVALALFLPVVLAVAESVSIQSVSLALQFLQGRPPTWSELGRKLRREATTGLLLGASCALLVSLAAGAWLKNSYVISCLLGGITGGVLAAALLGVTIPNILHLLRRDPHVASGPISLALTDMATLVLYFATARLLS